MKSTVVLYPFPLMGHLISMVELGKLILKHQPSFSIIIFVASVPHDTAAIPTYIKGVAATTPTMSFRLLPPVSLSSDSSAKMENLFFEVPRLNNPNIRQAFQEICLESRLSAFIIDFFCNAAFEVSTGMNIPTYFFYTSGASALCEFLYLPTLHSTITKDIKDLNTKIQVPGTPPVHSLDFPQVLFERESTSYKNFLATAINMRKSSGLITNTFEALEPRAVKALSDGLCTLNAPTPPIYCIGPIISSERDSSKHECLSWLDLQQSNSVVFLCFGSMGTFTVKQLKEMAIGLENSGQRFLWVVRNPPADDKTNQEFSQLEPDLDALLPEGFLERTRDRGLVVKSWAPQVAVLSHDAVGGFVTHCGWNSVLEAVIAGVPMVGWPLYAEQRMNRVFLVEEMKVALALAESENGFVMAAELENRVRELIDSERGRATKDQVMAMRDAALAAVQAGGSSHMALGKLIGSWI